MGDATTTPGGDSDFKRPSAAASEEAIRAVFRQDHERLEQHFEAIVAEASSTEPGALRQVWQSFERELLRHFDDEEANILPAFAQQKPTEARALLYEHQRIRAELTTLGVDLDLHSLSADRITDFVGTLRAHARHEDDLLYPWAAHRISDAARRRAHQATPTFQTPAAGSELWQIDLERSLLRFSLHHIVFHQIRGRFGRWGGTLTMSGADLATSSVRVWVDLDSVDTDDSGRDAQIRSAEFFDVGRFPQAHFTSTEVRLPERANPVVRGRLDLHGVTDDVEVELTRHNRWTDDEGTDRASYVAVARVDRRKFGLRWNQDLDVGGVVVGDDIEVTAQLEAVRVKAAP